MKKLLIILIILAVLLIGYGAWALKDRAEAPTVTTIETPTSTPVVTDPNGTSTATTTPKVIEIEGTLATSDLVVVTKPTSGASLSSPFEATGRARGNWYFEASAPVTVMDDQGNVLGQGHVEAQGEWMTTEFVPFRGTIEFSNPNNATKGFVIFMNDNPSGMAENSRYVRIPVTFSE